MKLLVGVFCFLFSVLARADMVDELMAPYKLPSDIDVGSVCCFDEKETITIEDTTIRFPMAFGTVKVKATSVMIIDQETGATLYAKNEHAVVPIASITKLMTAMVTLDNVNRGLVSMDDKIRISMLDINWLKRTHSRLNAGTVLTRREVLRLALMSSDNRAAHALARTDPEGFDAFVAKMNDKATKLGLVHTEFYDPTGLTPKNVSTAVDLVKMVQAAYTYDTIREFSSTEQYKVVLPGKKKRTRITVFKNSNALIHTHKWTIGLSKTGYIKDAGRCVVMQAEIADRPVIIVLLDSKTKKTRVKDATTLKEWVEDVFGKLKP